MQKRYLLLAPLASLLATAPRLALAQTTPAGSVGIGTTAPDASAALDIVSSSKGALLPRLTRAQVAAIARPATGLLVFQTDGTPGFYYNAGTPAAPGWQLLGAGTGTGDNLGNHTATQALKLGTNALVGTGALISGVGVGIRADGGLNLGQRATGHNLLLGYQAGQALAPDSAAGEGLYNQFSGYQSGQATITGSANLFSGYQSGFFNTGTGNQFVGYQAGYSNTSGEGNQFSGYNSGYSNTTGNANVFSGARSGFANTTGSNNQYLGFGAGSNATAGSQNLFVGYGSGLFHQTGSNNTALGANAGPDRNSPALDNATALGANAVVSQSNSLVLGNNASVGIGTPAPTEKLHVVGTIYSSAGGFKFPDGTVQTTAASSAAAPQLTLAGQDLSISGGNTVTLPTQQLALNGRALSISGASGNTVTLPTDLDNQTLSIAGSTISLTNGGSVTVPSSADNLGNHTATQTLGLNGNYLSNDPSQANGLRLDNAGNATLSGRLGIGTSAAATPAEKLEIRDGNVQLTGTGPAAVGISNTTSSLNLGLASSAGEYSALAQPGDAVLRSNGQQLWLSAQGGGNVVVSTGPTGSEAERLRVADGGVGIGTAGAPDASAILDVKSTTKGVLLPRLTQAQRDAIASPAVGLTLYNTTTAHLNTWTGTAWDASLSATEQVVQNAPITYNYTKGEQVYTVPANVYSLGVDAVGAQGGPSGGGRGLGGRVQTTLDVLPGQVLRIYVGGIGTRAGSPGTGGGGYNGGGNGTSNNYGGGGATDIRRGGASPADRIVVAGGGGGTAGVGGGAGGGLVGAVGGLGDGTYPGQGGTQTAGGAGALGVGDGAFFQGGTGNFSGGGGGWYGGGGGGRTDYYGGGGGGSSYVTPTGSSGTVHTQGFRQGNGYLTLTPSPAIAAPALDGRNFVNVPGDNLGNHTATQALNLGANALVGNGGTSGLTIAASGAVAVNNLAGSSLRVVTAAPNGTLATQALPTDAQQLSLSGSTLSLTNGGSVTLPTTPGDNLGNHTATQALNLGTNALVGNGGTSGLTIAANGTVTTAGALTATGTTKLSTLGNGSSTRMVTAAPDGTLATQALPTDAQQLSLSGSTLSLTNGGSVSIPDAQQLSLSGSTLALTNGGSVTLPGDNLGNHTATQNLNLAAYKLTGNGGANGLSISSGGSVGVGTTGTLNQPLVVQAGTASNAPLLGFYTTAGADKYNFSLQGGGLNLSESGVAGGRLFVQDATGNVGIGNTNPGQKLDVAGNARVSGSITTGGSLGVGTTAPAGGLHVTTGNGGPGTGTGTAGVVLSGAAGQPPYLELRGSGTSSSPTTPYLDFAETNDQDYNTRLISQGGVLNVSGAGTNGVLLQVNGGLRATNYANLSDARFKANVRPLAGALASVLALRGVRYEWNALGIQHGGTAGAPQVGVLAQEVEKIYPELVSTDKDGYKAVNYAQLTPVLIEALKEQQAQIEALKAAAAAAKAEAGAANTRAAAAEAKATQATATLDTFEARLRALEAGGTQARR